MPIFRSNRQLPVFSSNSKSEKSFKWTIFGLLGNDNLINLDIGYHNIGYG